MQRACVFLAVLGACGRVGFDPSPTDASRDALDALGPLVIPTEPFTNIQAVPVINDTVTADDDPTLPADMLEIIFDSERTTAAGDLFSSTRTDIASPWSTPVRIDELSSGNDEDGPCLSPDGLTITFASSRSPSAGANDLWMSTRSARGIAWNAPARIVELSTAADEKRLCVTDDGLTGAFYSDATASTEVYFTARTSRSDAWGAPVAASFNSAASDDDPYVHPTGLVVAFDTDRVQMNNFELVITSRASLDDPFGVPAPLAGVNTGTAETDPWLSPDLRTLFFVRGGGNSRDILMATR